MANSSIVPKTSDSKNWWFSSDSRRGFCWDSVVGFDYKEGGKTAGFNASVLYVYLTSAILTLHGNEADNIVVELRKRGVKN